MELTESSNLLITNSQRKITISLASATKVAEFLLESSGNKGMALYFVGKKKISNLHAQFFNDPSSTDCITFPIREPDFLGEIFVCPQTALEYIKKHGGGLYNELNLYVVHGFLHLLGFDDQTEEEEKQMRKLEKKWLSLLAKNNLGITP